MSLLKSVYRSYAQLGDEDPASVSDEGRRLEMERRRGGANCTPEEDLEEDPSATERNPIARPFHTKRDYSSSSSSSPSSVYNANCPLPTPDYRFASITLLSLVLAFLCIIGVLNITKHHGFMLESRFGGGGGGFGSSVRGRFKSSEIRSSSLDNNALPANTYEDAVSVKTECGKLIGNVQDGAFVFKGIRYAAPPVGNLRWSRPVPVWRDSRYCKESSRVQANKFGSPCFQVVPYNKQFEGREDCLFLNVWTPRLDNFANLEVMVWIHGGFLQFGSGHQPGLRPSGRLAKNMNMVFVSLNYRLFALGFLALDQLANSGANSSFGNYGLWDQVVALEWIQKNIKSFGGDPKKVTVFGPDGGGTSILALMTNSDSKRLFRSAWILGPALYFNQSFESTSRQNIRHFLHNTGCEDAKCLRSLSPKNITLSFLGHNDPSFRINDQNDLPIQGIFPEQLIVLDDELVVDTVFSNGSQLIDIPLLIGTTEQSIEFWPGPVELRNWSWGQYEKYVTTSLDSFSPYLSMSAIEMYLDLVNGTKSNQSRVSTTATDNTNNNNNSNTSPTTASSSYSNTIGTSETTTPELLYATMVSDVRQTCPIDGLAEKIGATLAVYRYVVKSRPSSTVRVYDYESQYSFHLWDAIAFFDQIGQFIRYPTESDYNFRNNLQRLVQNFVGTRKGNLWKPFPESVAYLSDEISYELPPENQRCKFWTENNLTNYVWIC